MHMSRHALRYIFLGKGRLVEEEKEVENENESFSNEVVTDYSATYLFSNNSMIGEQCEE